MRKIAIPLFIFEQIYKMSRASYEKLAIILHYPARLPNIDECADFCCYFRIVGIGNRDHVRADPTEIEILNRFLEKYPHFGYMAVHNHPGGSKRLSHIDLKNFKDKSIGYKEMLVVHEEYPVINKLKRIIHGEDKIYKILERDSYYIVNNYKAGRDLNKIVKEDIRKIEKELGYSLLQKLRIGMEYL